MVASYSTYVFSDNEAGNSFSTYRPSQISEASFQSLSTYIPEVCGNTSYGNQSDLSTYVPQEDDKILMSDSFSTYVPFDWQRNESKKEPNTRKDIQIVDTLSVSTHRISPVKQNINVECIETIAEEEQGITDFDEEASQLPKSLCSDLRYSSYGR